MAAFTASSRFGRPIARRTDVPCRKPVAGHVDERMPQFSARQQMRRSGSLHVQYGKPQCGCPSARTASGCQMPPEQFKQGRTSPPFPDDAHYPRPDKDQKDNIRAPDPRAVQFGDAFHLPNTGVMRVSVKGVPGRHNPAGATRAALSLIRQHEHPTPASSMNQLSQNAVCCAARIQGVICFGRL